MESWNEPKVPGLGDTQRRLLAAVKRRGRSSISELAEQFDLSAGTLREHLNALSARGFMQRIGTRRQGPGRPEILYSLTERGEDLFPSGESELLGELVRHLLDTDQFAVLERFFEARIEERREQTRDLLDGVVGEARLETVARVFDEAGFLAEVANGEQGEPLLRLCHCPLRTVVEQTRLPCRAEGQLLEELVGEKLERIEYIPDGDSACAYRARSLAPGSDPTRLRS